MTRRARRSFWILVVIAALATGMLSTTLTARPAPLVGIGVAVSSIVLATAIALAMRILARLEPTRRKETP